MGNASRFRRPDFIADQPRAIQREKTCAFHGCDQPLFSGIPVCFTCALDIAQYMRSVLDPEWAATLEDQADDPDPEPEPRTHVYYLRLSPVTVTIGTTTPPPEPTSGAPNGVAVRRRT
jgi:hypothetical protein